LLGSIRPISEYEIRSHDRAVIWCDRFLVILADGDDMVANTRNDLAYLADEPEGCPIFEVKETTFITDS
jgi:hypothetical protein